MTLSGGQSSSECPARSELAGVIAGTLSESASDSIFEHVSTCEACLETIPSLMAPDTLEAALRMLRGDPQELDPEYVQSVVSRAKLIASSQLPSQSTDATSVSDGLQQEVDDACHEFFASAEAEDEIGRLAGYRILKVLDSGGMGIVFVAEDSQLKRPVALKVMKPRYVTDSLARKRYLREAQAVAALRDDHIVTIYQVGEQAGVPFLVMELLDGESLEARLRRDTMLPIADLLKIGREIAIGLSVAHSKGLIHRDIKPSNVWLERLRRQESLDALVDQPRRIEGQHDSSRQTSSIDSHSASGEEGNRQSAYRVKLLDFGLARSIDEDSQLTSAGMILGTPSYMAPEQARGDEVDARSDLFSLGCVLYRMLTGQPPFRGSDVMATLTALATHEPASPDLVRADIPGDLLHLVMNLLSKKQDARPGSAREVAQQLAEISARLGIQPSLATAAKQTDKSVRSSNRFAWALMGIAVTVMLAVVIVKIRTNDGKVMKVIINTPGEVDTTQTIVRDNGGTVAVTKTEDPRAGDVVRPPSGEQNAIGEDNLHKANATKFITLAGLDHSQIPNSEHFAGQPRELVAVIGQHRLRDWNPIQSVSFHPSGAFFITGSVRDTSYLWSTKTLERRMGTGDPGFPTGIDRTGCQFTPDGKFLYTAHGKYEIDLSDPEHPKFKFLGKPPGSNYSRNDVISPDGRWIATIGDSGVKILDLAGDFSRISKVIELQLPHGPHATNLISSKDGRRLALVAAYTHDILLLDAEWDAADGPKMTPFGEPLSGSVAALSPDGQKLVKSNADRGKSQVLDLTVTPPRVEFEFGGSNQFEFSPDGQWLFSSGPTLLQNTAAGWEVQSLPATDGFNAKFWLSPDGKTLVVAEYYFGVMRAWDLTVNPPVERIPTRHYRAVNFSPDGRLLAATGGDADTVFRLDGAAPQLVAEFFLTGGGNFLPPTFSPDSNLLAFQHQRSGTQVWNLSLPKPEMIADPGTSFTMFAPHGTAVQSHDAGGWISRSWEITKRGRFRLGDEKTDLRSVKTAAGRYVRQQESNLTVWSVNDDTNPLFDVQHPDQIPIEEFALSDSGDLLAAFTPGGRNLVWDLTETPPREFVLAGRTTHNTHSFFAGDDKRLVVAHDNGLDIHDWVAGRLTREFRFGNVRGLARHPDGQHLATVNSNGTIYILRLPELASHLGPAHRPAR